MRMKYNLRLLQPNTDVLPTAAVHTLEHLMLLSDDPE